MGAALTPILSLAGTVLSSALGGSSPSAPPPPPPAPEVDDSDAVERQASEAEALRAAKRRAAGQTSNPTALKTSSTKSTLLGS